MLLPDEPDTHVEDDDLDTDGEPDHTNDDDGQSPADTDEESDKGDSKDDSKKAEAKEKQKLAWLSKIKSGKATLEDMPENLGWLKKEIKADLEPDKPAEKTDLSAEVRKVLKEERAQEEFDFLVDDLRNSDITAEQEADLRENYENLISEFSNPTHVQKVKVLMIARKLAGLKDTSESILERRRKGMSLPPFGTKKRSTSIKKDEMTEIEKKLSGNLPPGFKA